GWANALPAHTAGLAPVDVDLLGIANFADGCAAAHINVADFAGRQTQLGEATLTGYQLDRSTSGTSHLGAAAWAELHSVNHGTNRDVTQRQVVAWLDVSVRTGLNGVTLVEVVRCDDVALGAVHVVEQGDTSGTVRVVLDVSNLCRNAVLVVTTEVDHAVCALVSATLVSGGDLTGVVTATALGERANQRLFRSRSGDFCEVGYRRAAQARGSRLKLTNSHLFYSS